MKTLLITTVLLSLALASPSEARRHALKKRPLTHRSKISLMDIDWPLRCQIGLTAQDRALFDRLSRLDGLSLSFNYEIEEFCET